MPFITPNHLSLMRGCLGIIIPFLILSSSPAAHIWSTILFAVGAGSDYFDGWLARKYNMVSDFGKFIDPLTDKIIILAPLAAFSAVGAFSFWWIVPIFLREIIVTFCRTAWLMEGKSFGAESLGKWKFGLQVFLVSILLLASIALDYSVLEPFGKLVMFILPGLLSLVIFLTLFSGITFLLNHRTYFFSTAFAKFVLATGVGFLPKAPGTWGSALGFLIVFLVQINGWIFWVTFAGLITAGYWAYKQAGDLGEKDPGFIVIDEVCGMFVTMMFIPLLGVSLTWSTALFGFLLFRIFDIWKPFPIRYLEKIEGYWGVMADDLLAGLYAFFIMLILF